MNDLFTTYNLHLSDIELFAAKDPHLYRLQQQPLVHNFTILNNLDLHTPGIYTLGGGRQIGKSTLLKQWMLFLLRTAAINPRNIFFLSGELIDDHHSLYKIMQTQLNTMETGFKYLIIDEITYISQWDKAIKFAADLGMLQDVVLILTGSDLSLTHDAKMLFPGRRGRADKVDFHLYPLNFAEVLALKKCIAPTIDDLFIEFNYYLQHGGYLTAINDLAKDGQIAIATLNTYSDWIRGDILKKGKQEIYLKEILTSIIKKYNSQLTWHSLAKDLSIDHHQTVADYVTILANMDAVYIQPALLEDKLIAAPKKAKKIVFADPFIYHAIFFWLYPVADPYHEQIKPAINNPEVISTIVEAAVATSIRRIYPTYYIKAEGEVDIAYIKQDKFWPIEIKWTNQLRPQDLKQIKKYPNAKVWSKIRHASNFQELLVEPLPEALANFMRELSG